MKMHTKIIHNTLYPLTPEYVNKELFKILNKISSEYIFITVGLRCKFISLSAQPPSFNSLSDALILTNKFLTDTSQIKIYTVVDYIVVNLDDNKLKFLNHVLLEYGKVLNKMDNNLNYFYPDSLYVKYFEINI